MAKDVPQLDKDLGTVLWAPGQGGREGGRGEEGIWGWLGGEARRWRCGGVNEYK